MTRLRVDYDFPPLIPTTSKNSRNLYRVLKAGLSLSTRQESSSAGAAPAGAVEQPQLLEMGQPSKEGLVSLFAGKAWVRKRKPPVQTDEKKRPTGQTIRHVVWSKLDSNM
ncbi:hypothetical protein RRG08_028857 [Elysia crispata]|uniref:Uncharacterized protein n=1 Tax=Elysia crispata TaxID=231223 RepID=A0AAE1D7R6_9GAST|nr:hypothetical protein RRG08_028857 [Elysia crispata]